MENLESYNKIPERYQKSLVTVAMGFRTEDEIKKGGLYRFNQQEKEELIKCLLNLFEKNNSVLVLKVKQVGFRSEHINIDSKKALDYFLKNIDNIFNENNEIWIVFSSVVECWRCRLYLSGDGMSDSIEMAYSYDDHILDHIDTSFNVPYVYYEKSYVNYKVSNTNLSLESLKETSLIIKDIFSKYSTLFEKVRDDLYLLNIKGISLDILVNKGYVFHDFDVTYGDVKRVIKYYMKRL